jgi:hypothetical protein
MISRLTATLLALATHPVLAATDLWDLPPLRYSDTAASDPIARLAAEIGDGKRKLPSMNPLERLRFILKLLDVPEESQVLVYSKTSKQNALINPANPRCVFFNENSYVGYVPGGSIEVITSDALLGSVYYLIESGGESEPMRISRDTSDCLSCHGTARTESVPGVLVRSVFPDSEGQPLLALGTFQIDHTSPLQERWGGYYVTGRSSLPHLGNRTYTDTQTREFPTDSLVMETLVGKIDISRYLRATSDIVALMVLEHQCLLHNQLVSAAMNYRRIHWLQKSLDPHGDPDGGTAGKHADESARRIVDLLLFENEAPLGDDGIEGSPAFQEAFTRRFPKTEDDRSLADFQLNDRLFKHRCSYMLYSQSFKNLPPRVMTAILARLKEVLAAEPGPENHPQLKSSERRKISSILAATVPGYQ